MVLGPSGVAWATIKVTLNGARQDIRDIKGMSERTEARVNRSAETLARLEERSEDHDRRIGKLEDAEA